MEPRGNECTYRTKKCALVSIVFQNSTYFDMYGSCVEKLTSSFIKGQLKWKKNFFLYESLLIVMMHGIKFFVTACLVYQIMNEI